MELSEKSLKNVIKSLNEFKVQYDEGVKNAIKTATDAMYESVLRYCYDNGISEHTSSIHKEYDETTNTGRVWTDDEVIIFNEMGTGITGKNSPHPNPNGVFGNWEYDVNGHGEKGWKYPKGDGTFGWTKGLPSRHMFYSAFNDIKDEIGTIVNVEVARKVGGIK